MKTKTLLLLPVLFMGISAHAATTCSRQNLTRCLDSVCAINASSNPSARCQYCGTSNAGTPPTKNGMRSVSVGASAKYNLTDKELKKAPTDPGERYAWATAQCVARVAGCTTDDVTDTYDKLIEQSCRAAGVSAQLDKTLTQMAKKKSQTTCAAEIRACLVNEKRCTANYRNCDTDVNFDKFFSECSVESNDCGDYLTAIRDELMASRDSAIDNASELLANIVASYQSARDKKISTIKSECASGVQREKCIETVCETNMNNKCAPGFEGERSMATLLCKFWDIACATVD